MVILISMIYLMVALGIGLVISEVTKNQFLACQSSLLISFLPCFVLSGFIFDLRSTPIGVQLIGAILPFSHYLTCIRALFLSGTHWGILLKEGGLLLFIWNLLYWRGLWDDQKEGGMMEGIQLYLEQLAVICRKEILAIWQDKATRLIIVVPCIILGFLFGYAANYNLEKAPYAVIDLSHSKESAELISRIDGTGFFQRAVTLQNAEEISDYINRGEVVMAVSIPPDFSRRLNHAQEAPVQVIADGRNTVIAGQVIGHMGQIISRYNQERSGSKSPVALEMRTWFNPNQITRWFFLPGIIGLLSFSQVFLLSGLSVAREREEGTFEQILVAPISEPLSSSAKPFHP